jgi:hypothetical protein
MDVNVFKNEGEVEVEARTSTIVAVTSSPHLIPGAVGRDGLGTGHGHSLQSLVSQAKGALGVKQFMVWHTLTGYWAGVQPPPMPLDGEAVVDSSSLLYSDLLRFQAEVAFAPLASLPRTMLRMSRAQALASEPFTTLGVGLVHPELAESFFREYHASLRAMGVDGVKVRASNGFRPGMI